MLVVGVDGWKGGWVAVRLRNGVFETALAAATIVEILGGCPHADAEGIDIPIGLPPPFPRRADLAAKTLLGSGAPSVFMTFPEEVYRASLFADAVRIAVERCGMGLSQQSWRLGPKILEAAAIEDERVFEVHPEVSFRALAGRPLPSKKTWAGQEHRRHALATAGIFMPGDLGEAGKVPPVTATATGRRLYTLDRQQARLADAGGVEVIAL